MTGTALPRLPVRSLRVARFGSNPSLSVAGEYETVLSFRKGEEGEVHTVEFTFNIRDRATLEIPRRKGGGGS